MANWRKLIARRPALADVYFDDCRLDERAYRACYIDGIASHHGADHPQPGAIVGSKGGYHDRVRCQSCCETSRWGDDGRHCNASSQSIEGPDLNRGIAGSSDEKAQKRIVRE